MSLGGDGGVQKEWKVQVTQKFVQDNWGLLGEAQSVPKTTSSHLQFFFSSEVCVPMLFCL